MLRDEALRLALEASGTVVLTIVAGDRSMEPTLYGGDAVLAVPLTGEPARGNILVFRQNDDLVVHRFLGPAKDRSGAPCLRTRGDGRGELDPPLSRENVRAKVVALRRAGTWRTLEGAMPRFYAALVAWHDLAWAGAIHLCRPARLSGVPRALDRSLLRLTTAVVSPLAHRRKPAPLADGRGVSV